jgi:hypothetical protein
MKEMNMKTHFKRILAVTTAVTLSSASMALASEISPMAEAGLLAPVTLSQEPGTGKIPSVELYMNQNGVLARQGDLVAVTVTGAVYDFPFLVGDIGLAPNNNLPPGPTNPACPAFLSGGAINTGAPIGQNVLSVPVTLRIPPNTAPGTYNCALKYVAIYKSPYTGISYSVGKGNQVNIPYTVRRAQ